MTFTEESSEAAGTNSMVGRVFSVLDAFSTSRRTLRLAEIADSAGLPRPTAMRIIRQLVEHGALVRHGMEYEVGPRMWHLGLLAAVQSDLRDVAAPFLNDLHAATRATVHLAVREGDGALYLDRLAGSTSVPVVSRVGETLPMHCTGVGKILLAYAPDDVRRRVLDRLSRQTAHTLTNRSVLTAQLDEARRRGFATTSEEMTLGACSVAVPVLAGGAAVAALGVVVPRLGRDTARFVTAMTVAARGVGRMLEREALMRNSSP
nr:IclR family transcriptional regulator [Rhodococcus sp. BP-241]